MLVSTKCRGLFLYFSRVARTLHVQDISRGGLWQASQLTGAEVDAAAVPLILQLPAAACQYLTGSERQADIECAARVTAHLAMFLLPLKGTRLLFAAAVNVRPARSADALAADKQAFHRAAASPRTADNPRPAPLCSNRYRTSLAACLSSAARCGAAARQVVQHICYPTCHTPWRISVFCQSRRLIQPDSNSQFRENVPGSILSLAETLGVTLCAQVAFG
jgi:hypothetical protein